MAILLVALSVAACCYRLGAARLLSDPNEAEYAEVAREMVHTENWLTPQLNYVVFLNKPPLAYWLIALSDLALGVNEFAARLPCALAGIAIVLMVVLLGARLYEIETGLLAGFILLTTAGFFVETHEVRPDLLLVAGVVGSLLAMTHFLDPHAQAVAAKQSGTAETESRTAGLWPLMGFQVALAVAVLAKGMIGLLLPGLIGLVLIVSERRFGLLQQLLHPRGWWLFLLLIAPWHVAMSLQHPGFLWDYLVNQHVLFFLDRKLPRDSLPVSLAGFWLAFGLRLLPWTLFAPLALIYALRGARRPINSFGDRFVLAWTVVVLGFFSLTPSRLEHYSLPALPALALLNAKLFRDYARGIVRTPARVVTVHVIGFAALALLGPFVVPRIVASQAWLAAAPSLVGLARWVFGLLAVGGAVAALAVAVGLRAWVPYPLIAAFVLCVPFIQVGMASFASVDSSAGMAAVLRAVADPGEAVVYQAPVEYQSCAGFNFYLRRKIDLLRPSPSWSPPTYLRSYSAALFIDRAHLEAMWREERVFLITDTLLTRAALRRIAPAPFFIVARDNTRWVVTNRPL